jgi:transposase
MKMTTGGIELAKNAFQVHAINEHGKTLLKSQLSRDQVPECFAKLPACLSGLDTCGSTHHWARKLAAPNVK